MIWCFKKGDGENGFTLIESLVILMVVSLVMGLVTPSVFSTIEKVRMQSEQKRLTAIFNKVQTLAFCRNEPITVSLDNFHLKVSGVDQTGVSIQRFTYLHFETATIVFNANGFADTRALQYRINGDDYTFRF